MNKKEEELSLALMICTRPNFYFKEVSFETVVSYLNGFYSGLEVGKLADKYNVQAVSESEWEKFSKWLEDKYGGFNVVKENDVSCTDRIESLNKFIKQYIFEE